jgi:hypothetical protein
MDGKQKTKDDKPSTNILPESNDVTSPDIWKVRATVAEIYCTKEDAREIKKDVHKRIDDIWRVVVPLVVAILGLIGVIFYLIMTRMTVK